jgi:hypothetical protein
MAESDEVDISQLREAAQVALLTAIATKASNAAASQLDGLAYAYSLVVGAAPGKLPGLHTPPRQ